ncbi:MAG: hypothetical protein ACJ76S_08735 [Solirubrobacteraceae bacterium]|jgi:hypothetical protein
MKRVGVVGLVAFGLAGAGCGDEDAGRPALATTPMATPPKTETAKPNVLGLDQDLYEDLKDTAAEDCRTTPRAGLAKQNQVSPSVSDQKLAEEYGKGGAHKGTPEARQALIDGCYTGLEEKGR